MNWKDRINGWLDTVSGWLGITHKPEPVPVPVRKNPRKG